MDDLSNRWNKLSLSEREGGEFKFQAQHKSQEFSIVAKFYTLRILNVEAVARTFNPIWRSKNGFQIQNLGEHRLLFIFDNKADVDRVLQNEPWSFDKHVVILQVYNKTLPLRDLVFRESLFWVQVHDIPIAYKNQAMVEELCSVISEVIHMPGGPSLGGQGFLRVRVRVDVTQPLCRGRIVSLENGEQSWVAFRYERLPNVCYWCGCLDHADKDCKVWIHSNGSLKTKYRRYDSSIRALPFYSSSKNVVCVPGYFESQKQRLKEKAAHVKKANQSGKDDHSFRPTVQTETEGADISAGINNDLNLNREDSSPCFQSQNEARTVDMQNPINLERIFGDLETHENPQHFGPGCVGNETTMDPTSSPCGPGIKSPNRDTPLVNPGLVRETSDKWARATRSSVKSDELAHPTNLGKRHAEVHELLEAKRRSKNSEHGDSSTSPTVEVVQQPRREL